MSAPPPPPPGWDALLHHHLEQLLPAPSPSSARLQTSSRPSHRQVCRQEAKWLRMQRQRFGEKRRGGFVETQKADMPPEHLRKIVKILVMFHRRSSARTREVIWVL
ncbi:unnamed protein product [Aureobasidium pullulans]|nr:unnamed protein product [Aureobasidium pullulans]